MCCELIILVGFVMCVCVYVCRCEPATCWWSTGTRGEPAPGERPPSPAARRRPSSYSWVTRRRLSTRRRHLRIWPPATVTAAQPKRYRSDNWGGVRRIFVWMVGKQGFPLKHLKYRQVLTPKAIPVPVCMTKAQCWGAEQFGGGFEPWDPRAVYICRSDIDTDLVKCVYRIFFTLS